MNTLRKYKQFLGSDTRIKSLKIHINDSNPLIRDINQTIFLGISSSSLGMYDMGEDIEKFTGLPKEKALNYPETENDAFVAGMCNLMNGGRDIFQWHNGIRLRGETRIKGILPGLFGHFSHECVHLTRLILTKHIFEKKFRGSWFLQNLEIGDKNHVDEETFATLQGFIVEQLTPHFLELSEYYIPELSFFK